MNLIKNRNFLLLAIGSFISTIGDHIYNFALTVWLYNVSGSVTSVAIMWLSRVFFRIPVQYISGIFADRFNKKSIITLTNFLSVPLAFSLIFINNKNLFLAYFIVFLLQSLNDMDMTAESSLLPEIVDKHKLAEYNSVFSVLGTIALLASPALAGIIYKLWGIYYLFILNAISFLIAGISFMFIKYIKEISETTNNRTSLFKSGMEGVSIIKQKPVFILLFIAVMSLAILGRFYEIFKVYIADSTLNIGTDGIVYFSYAMALGGFLTPFILKQSKRIFKDNLIYSFSVFAVISTLCYFMWGTTRNIYISLVSLFVLGIFSSCYLVTMTTLLQKETPKEYTGRVFAFYKIAITFSAMLGIIISPYMLKVMGSFGSFLIFSIISLISVFFIVVNSMGIKQILKSYKNKNL